MTIRAIRITLKGQQAVAYLTAPEPAPNSKKPVLSDSDADKLSIRKATILAATANGKWVDMLHLLRRLRNTGEFEEIRKGVHDLPFKLTNEMIGLSDQGYIRLGRHMPRACCDCGQLSTSLFVLTELDNETWDGSDASQLRASAPRCKDCFEKVADKLSCGVWPSP